MAGCSLDGAVKLNHGLTDIAVNWSGNRKCLYVCVFVYMCVFVYANMRACTCVCVCLYVCMYVYMHVFRTASTYDHTTFSPSCLFSTVTIPQSLPSTLSLTHSLTYTSIFSPFVLLTLLIIKIL